MLPLLLFNKIFIDNQISKPLSTYCLASLSERHFICLFQLHSFVAYLTNMINFMIPKNKK